MHRPIERFSSAIRRVGRHRRAGWWLNGCFIAAVLAAFYTRRIIWHSSPDTAANLAPWVRTLAATRQDALVMLCLGILSLVSTTLRPGARAAAMAICAAACVLSIMISASNVAAVSSVGAIIDLGWLADAKLSNLGTATPMVASVLTPSLKRAFVVCLLAIPLFAAVLAWALAAWLRWQWIIAAVAAIALGATVAASGTDPATDPGTRVRAASPVLAFVRTALLPSQVGAYLTGSATDLAGADVSDFVRRPAMRSTSACCVRDNVLFIVIDTLPYSVLAKALRPEFSRSFGNLQLLAREGAQFDRFYSNFTMSAQVMGVIESGLYPSFQPLLTNMEELGDRELPTLSRVFASSGHSVSHFMSGQLKYGGARHFLEGRGFEEIRDSDDIACRKESLPVYSHVGDDCTAAEAIRWLRQRGSTEKPFFLWVWFNNPHSPYFTTDRATKGSPLGDRAQHWRALAETDRAIGSILAQLRRDRQYERTLVVVMGDHGEAFGEHGQVSHGTSVYQEQVHVPLLMRAPGLRLRGRYSVVGSTVDIAPTLADLAGLPTAAGWQGASLFSHDRSMTAFFSSMRGGRTVGFVVGDRKYIASVWSDAVQRFDLSTDPLESSPTNVGPRERDWALRRMGAMIRYRQSLSLPGRQPSRQ